MVIGDRLIDLMGAGLVDTKRVLINNTKIKINRILSDHSYPLAVFLSVRFKAGPNRDTDRGLLNWIQRHLVSGLLCEWKTNQSSE